MKKLLPLLLCIIAMNAQKALAQNIAINSTGDQPDTSAMLDVSSTIKGFLPPRMTTTQQNAIPLPAKGLLIFNTTDNTVKVNAGTPLSPSWSTVTFSGGGGSTTNNISSSVNTITSNVNGVSSSTTAVNSVSNSSANNVLSTTVNGISGSGVSIVNSISNTVSANNLSTTVNGVTGANVNLINSNVLSLSGSNLTATINGYASNSLALPLISNMNGLSGSTQTFSTGTSGTNFAISSSGTTHTFNLPDASATARGVISTNTQTIAGAKTFTGNSTFSGILTASSSTYLTAIGTGNTSDEIVTINTADGRLFRRTVASILSGNNGLTSLNSLTGATQTFSTGTTGTDFNISSSGSVHTFNIPDASTTARGVVTTGAQTFAGAKTFSSNVAVGGTLAVTGATTLSSTLAVTGSAAFSSAVAVAGATALSSTLSVAGAASLSSTLSVAGAFTLSSVASGASTDSILTINSSGVVRKRTVTDVVGSSSSGITLLVAATRTSAYSPAAAYSIVAYNNATTNVGSAYNTSTGVFTAPSAGLYQISFSNQYSVANSVNNTLSGRIVVNNVTETEVATALTPYSGSTVRGNLDGLTIVQLSAGGTVSIQIGNLSNTMTPAVSTGQHTLKILKLN